MRKIDMSGLSIDELENVAARLLAGEAEETVARDIVALHNARADEARARAPG